MEITSPNLENLKQVAADPQRRNSSVTKFEMRSYDITDSPRKKQGVLSGIFKVMGGFAPVAYLAAPFTGGLSLIGGAAMSGLGYIGSKSAAKQTQPDAIGPQIVTATPGISPGGFNDPTLDLITASRDNAAGEAVHRIK